MFSFNISHFPVTLFENAVAKIRNWEQGGIVIKKNEKFG
jgi:hypothetical protein